MSSRVNNQALKENMKLLAIKVFALYNAKVNQYPTTQGAYQGVILLHLKTTIKEFDEYKTCRELINADASMHAFLGKLVGTLGFQTTIEDADTCIIRFIEQLYWHAKDKTFDPLAFDLRYEAFEELFYADMIRLRDTDRLYNFVSEMEEIVLEDGVAIRRRPHVQDEQTKFQEMHYRPFTQLLRSEFMIERSYTTPKIVGGFTPTLEQIDRHLHGSEDVFDKVIKALRMLKSSAVYRERCITTEQLTFTPFTAISSKRAWFENPIFGDSCVLTAQEVNEVQALFEKMRRVENQQRFNIASSRLAFGMERRSDEDKLLDYMIGLESLYLPDGNDELTFRLSLRVALFMAEEAAERQRIFKFVKKIYGTRSKIVHGSRYELTKEAIASIEELLRRSLKIYLDSPDRFTSENLENTYFAQ